MNFCKDCAHFSYMPEWVGFTRCNEPRAVEAENPVWGTVRQLSAEECRGSDIYCGPSGHWYEAKK